MFFLRYVVLFFSFILFLNGDIKLTKEEKAWIENNTMVVGVEQWTPVIFSNTGDDVDGLAGDVLNLIAKKVGLKMKIVNEPWDVILQSFKEGKIDQLPATFHTKEREEFGLYTKSFYEMVNYVYVKEDQNSIKSFADLRGKKLAIIKGYGTIPMVRELFPDIQIVETFSLMDSINRVLNGEVDGLLDGELPVTYKMKQSRITGLKGVRQAKLNSSALHLFTRKDLPTLDSILNKARNSLTDEELNKIIDKWSSTEQKVTETRVKTSDKEESLNFTQEEKNWIENNTIIVGVEQWTPVVFSNTGDDVDGLTGDVLNLMIEKAGLKRKIINEPWKIILNDFKEGKIDMLTAVFYVKEREEFGLYTKPFYKLANYIYVREERNDIKSLADLQGKKLAIVKGYATIEMVRELFPDIQIVETLGLNDSINRVLSGKIDGLLDGELAVKYKMKQNLVTGLKGVYQSSLKPLDLHFFTRTDLPILNSILSKTLNSLTDEELNKIIDKWISTEKKVEKKKVDISFLGLLSFAEIMFALGITVILIVVIYVLYAKEGALNIRFKTFNFAIILFELSVISFLIYEIIYLDRAENSLAHKYQELFLATELLTEFKSSSNDLSHLAKDFINTGKMAYKDKYFNTLKEVKDSDFEARILSLPFSKEELDLLKIAKDNFYRVIEMEKELFNNIELGGMYLATYSIIKERVGVSIDKVSHIFSKERNMEIDYLNSKISGQFVYILLIALLFVVGNITLYFILRKKINTPIEYLTDTIAKIQAQEQNIEKKTFYNDEIGQTIDQFFAMTEELQASKNEVEKVHKNIQDSINYASIIQHAILPDINLLNKYVSDSFIYWQPKDVVGGDIYFVREIKNGDAIIVIVIDGAGHGVPGAFVTMLVKAIETQMVADLNSKRLYPHPANILEYFNISLKKMLKQDRRSKSRAGFDGGVLYYNRETKVCKYAGAKTPLYIIRENGDMEIIKSDRANVGFPRTKIDQEYTEYDIEVETGMQLYIATDGIVDQEGADESRFGKTRLENMIQNISSETMDKQEEMIKNEFTRFKGDIEQSDDVTVVGVRF